jgi:hypothetical protein
LGARPRRERNVRCAEQERARARRTEPDVRSRQLEASLIDFAEQAAARLSADVAAGGEVPFELESRNSRGRGAASLYCYRPLTAEFVAERFAQLRTLPAFGPAVALLEGFDGLDRYLVRRGGEPGRRGARAEHALLALLEEIFEEQTSFELRPERLRKALATLDGAASARPGELTLVATLHGVTITSQELALARGLLIAKPHALQGMPDGAFEPHPDAPSGAEHLVVVFTSEQLGVQGALDEGHGVLRDLLRALRLYGDGRVTLGSLSWTRAGDGPWRAAPLGRGGRPHGMLVVAAEQEDELRAFCNLVSRRAPHRSEIAWALARFEMGCERESEYEAISDNLLALRALLGGSSELEPDGSLDGVLARRLAALCATPEKRASLAERTLAAIAIEREAIAGTAVERSGGLALARDLSAHVRALLRDVICGHLPADLLSLADELLLSGERLGEQTVGEASEPGEILHLAV